MYFFKVCLSAIWLTILVYCSGVTMKQQVSGCYLPAELGEGPPWFYLPTNWAVKHFHHYLYGVHFTVRTDHGALSWLTNFKNPEGQLARWLEVLGCYNFTIKHRAGIRHGNADGL
jgi:hypothetical protein